ncbi:MAG TPA: site-2 protease family protein [Candidatus Dormibacteraeota bacterium]|jgi:Zn-dependent protease|nr:site-2 protease family protein [Candidatus Dormibacteraeota bacterium]
MLFGDQHFLIQRVLFFIPALVIGFTLHEFSHALVANLVGDPTAKNQGRLTLNPVKHIDPIGMIMILVIGLGYAKPVPVNHSKMRGRLAPLLVALAGPGMNLIIAIVASIALKVIAGNSGLLGGPDFSTYCSLTVDPIQVLKTELFYIYTLNLFLMVFNLLPIPPLDGFELVRTILRRSNPRLLFQIEMNLPQIYIVILLIFLFLPGVLFFVVNFVAAPVAFVLGVPLIRPCP